MTSLKHDQIRPRGRTFVQHTLALTATGILAAAIAFLTLSPSQQDIGGILSDKAYHVIAFAALVLPCAVFYARSLV